MRLFLHVSFSREITRRLARALVSNRQFQAFCLPGCYSGLIRNQKGAPARSERQVKTDAALGRMPAGGSLAGRASVPNGENEKERSSSSIHEERRFTPKSADH